MDKYPPNCQSITKKCTFVLQVYCARTFTMKPTPMWVKRYVDCQRKSSS